MSAKLLFGKAVVGAIVMGLLSQVMGCSIKAKTVEFTSFDEYRMKKGKPCIPNSNKDADSFVPAKKCYAQFPKYRSEEYKKLASGLAGETEIYNQLLIGLATGAASAILFKSPTDLLKGLGLAAGFVTAEKNYNGSEAKAIVLFSGIHATDCIYNNSNYCEEIDIDTYEEQYNILKIAFNDLAKIDVTKINEEAVNVVTSAISAVSDNIVIIDKAKVQYNNCADSIIISVNTVDNKIKENIIKQTPNIDDILANINKISESNKEFLHANSAIEKVNTMSINAENTLLLKSNFLAMYERAFASLSSQKNSESNATKDGVDPEKVKLQLSKEAIAIAKKAIESTTAIKKTSEKIIQSNDAIGLCTSKI